MTSFLDFFLVVISSEGSLRVQDSQRKEVTWCDLVPTLRVRVCVRVCVRACVRAGVRACVLASKMLAL